jgi:hypothetical protein
MKDQAANIGGSAGEATSAPSLPAAVDRATFEAELAVGYAARRRHPHCPGW